MIYETAYLVGQISKDVEETYLWRERVRHHFYDNPKVDIIDPCFNQFNQAILSSKVDDEQRMKVYRKMGTDVLVPKDYTYVLKSTMAVANMNHYDPKKPILGSFFELAWYFANPQKTVIGIFDGNPKNDIICNHPFVRQAVDTWVKNDEEACKLIEYFYLV